MTATETQFSNETIQVAISREPQCKMRFEVKISPEAVQNGYKQAMKNVSKEVTMPGFRKGKVPESLLVKNYGSAIGKEWKRHLTSWAWNESCRLTKCYPFSENSLQSAEMDDLVMNQGTTARYAFECEPAIPQLDTSALRLEPIPTPPITSEQIDERLESIRWMFAEKTLMTDRGAQEDDLVTVDVTLVDKEPHERVCEDQRFQLAKGKVAAWLHTLMLGMTIDEHRETTSELDEKATEEMRKNFEPRLCRVTLKAIEAVQLPPIDEELAKKTGLASVDELKEKISGRITDELRHAASEQQKIQLRRQILELYPFEIPASLMDREAKQRLKQIQSKMLQEGLEATTIREEAKRLEPQVAEEVDGYLRMLFLSQQVADKEKIAVTGEDMTRYVQSIAAEGTTDMILKRLSEDRSLTIEVARQVLIDKVLDKLLTQLA